MERIVTKYKDIEIAYIRDEDFEYWKVECEYGEYKNVELRKIEEWIDRQVKKQFKRFKVIVKDYNGLSLGTVTSFDRHKYFVSLDSKSRGQYGKNDVAKQDSEKLKLYEEFKEIKKQESKILRECRERKEAIMKLIFSDEIDKD